MILRREKIYDGMVDVYDYVAEQHIKYKKVLRVVIGKEYMDLDWKKLKKPIKTSGPFMSKWTAGQSYKLLSYKWVPQKELTSDELIEKYVYQKRN